MLYEGEEDYFEASRSNDGVFDGVTVGIGSGREMK